MRGIHLSPVNSPRKGPVTRIMFPFDDVIVVCSALHHLLKNSASSPIRHKIYCEKFEDGNILNRNNNVWKWRRSSTAKLTVSICRNRPTCIKIPFIKERHFHYRPIFIKGIAIPGKMAVILRREQGSFAVQCANDITCHRNIISKCTVPIITSRSVLNYHADWTHLPDEAGELLGYIV